MHDPSRVSAAQRATRAAFLAAGFSLASWAPLVPYARRAGAQSVMPAGLAIAAISTVGYAGILIGPATIGFVAHLVGLHAAFWMLAVLVTAVPIAAGRATSG